MLTFNENLSHPVVWMRCGYSYGISSERKLVEERRMHLPFSSAVVPQTDM